MKKIFNNTLILIMSTTTLVYLINNINIKAYFRILPCITIFPILLIPKILNKLNFKLTEIEETLYYIFIFIAHFLGAIVNCYAKIWIFDLLAHTLSGILSFILGLKILKMNNKEIKINLFNIIFLFGFCFLVAGSWEIIEFIGDKLLKTNFQHSIETGVNDTMEDIICAFIGYTIALITYFKCNKKNYNYI